MRKKFQYGYRMKFISNYYQKANALDIGGSAVISQSCWNNAR